MAGWRGWVGSWFVLLFLMAATVFSVMDRLVLSLLIEPIKHDLGVDDAQIGLLNGVAFGLFYAAMGLPMGWLADRWSRKGVIALGIGVWSVSTAACGLAGSFWHLLVARIGVGAGEAGLSPAAFSIVHDRFPRPWVGRAMSLLQAGNVIGSGIALSVGGLVYGAFQAHGPLLLPGGGVLSPWQATFLTVAAPGALFALLILPIRVPRAVTAGAPPVPVVAFLRRRLAFHALLFLGMAGIVLVHYALLTWLPAVLIRESGWSPRQVGGSYGLAVTIFSPLGLLAGGTLADLLTRRRVAAAYALVPLVAIAVALPAALALPLIHDPRATVGVAAWIHFALGLPIGVVPAYLQLVTPAPIRVRLSALYVFVVNFVGFGLGPTVVGALSALAPADPTALRHSIGAVALAMLALSAVLLAVLVRRLKRAADPEGQGAATTTG